MTITPEMVHEAVAHVPASVELREFCEVVADRLTATLARPGVVCPCCGVTNLGEDCSELPWVKKMMAEYRKEDQA